MVYHMVYVSQLVYVNIKTQTDGLNMNPACSVSLGVYEWRRRSFVYDTLGMGTKKLYLFGPVRNWVNTSLLVSFRTNDTVIDACVVLSPYTSMLMNN